MAENREIMLAARATPTMVHRMNKAAESRGISRSEAVREALTQWLDREAKAAS